MDPRVAAIIRYSLLLAVGLVAFGFLHKHYSRHQEKKEIVAELQAATSDASFYRQFEAADARATLLRCVARVERARQLGLPPDELIDRVLGKEREFLSGETPAGDGPGDTLVRQALVSTHQAAERLGLLDDDDLAELARGELPRIDGGLPVIAPLIDPAVAPGLEKIIPNLELLPPGTQLEGRELNAIERAAARRLAEDLGDAGVIEREVARKIVDQYETPTEEEEEPEPEPAPEPDPPSDPEPQEPSEEPAADPDNWLEHPEAGEQPNDAPAPAEENPGDFESEPGDGEPPAEPAPR